MIYISLNVGFYLFETLAFSLFSLSSSSLSVSLQSLQTQTRLHRPWTPQPSKAPPHLFQAAFLTPLPKRRANVACIQDSAKTLSDRSVAPPKLTLMRCNQCLISRAISNEVGLPQLHQTPATSSNHPEPCPRWSQCLHRRCKRLQIQQNHFLAGRHAPLRRFIPSHHSWVWRRSCLLSSTWIVSLCL